MGILQLLTISDQIAPLISDQIAPLISDQTAPLVSDQIAPLISEQTAPPVSEQSEPLCTGENRQRFSLNPKRWAEPGNLCMIASSQCSLKTVLVIGRTI